MSGDFHFRQPSPKSKLLAHVLNLIFPGVGLLYWRRTSRGARWCALTLLICLSSVGVWVLYPCLPQLFAALMGLGWFMVQWHLFDSIRVEAPDHNRWRRRGGEFLPFLGLAFLCSSLVTLIIYVSFTRVYSLIHVTDTSMYPQILPGDVLLVNRRAQGDKQPNCHKSILANSPYLTGRPRVQRKVSK